MLCNKFKSQTPVKSVPHSHNGKDGLANFNHKSIMNT